MKEFTREERYRLLSDSEEIRPLHESIIQSNYRQTYHIQPVTGLLNDPNGFVFHNGQWHLFYQWCPWGAVHGLKYWYHTVSTDLLHWQNLGICISPDSEFDNKGAYSGSALLGKDSICLFYTGNHRDDDWTRKSYTCTVKMYDDGRYAKLPWPLFGPSPDYTEHQRDPKIVYVEHQKLYYILLGAQTVDKHGCVILYRSKDLLENWEFAGQLTVPGFEAFGDMWECPSIEHINGVDVLLFCPQHLKLKGRGDSIHHNGYLIGTMDWDTLTFLPDGSFHVLDFGFDSYAAECAANLDSDEKAVLVAWMGLPDASYPTDAEDWSGCLTLCRELHVRGRRLIQKPLPSLQSLRQQLLSADDCNSILPLSCELELSVPFTENDLTIKLFSKPDRAGGIIIHYDSNTQVISIDRSNMTNRFQIEHGEIREHILDHPLSSLRIFIDRSSLEIFVNDGDAVFTSRIFPTKEEHGFQIPDFIDTKIWILSPSVKEDFII